MAYRSTPQVSTGASPFFLMFGREMRSKLPEIRKKAKVTDEEVHDRDWSNKLQAKEYADERRGATRSNITVGDKVLVCAPKQDKLSPNFHPQPFTVTGAGKSEVTMRDSEGKELLRNKTFVKNCESAGTDLPAEIPAEDNTPTTSGSSPAKAPQEPPIGSPKSTTPARVQRNNM